MIARCVEPPSGDHSRGLISDLYRGSVDTDASVASWESKHVINVMWKSRTHWKANPSYSDQEVA